jgi:hypothetical protein
MKKHVILFAGIFCATVLSLAVCAVGAPRQSVGRPVDDGNAEPMCCVVVGCHCIGQDVWCQGASGAPFKVAHCPGACSNATCQ